MTIKQITYITICFLFTGLISCSSGSSGEEFRVAVLRGPSAIAFAQWMESPPTIEGKKVFVEIIDSPENMQALIIKREVQLAVLPMVNAANLYNKQIPYQLLGCPVWGTLFLVGTSSLEDAGSPIHIFGAGTTPDILTRYYLEKEQIQSEINYSFNTPREMLLALLAERVKKAVMSEPFLSMLCRQDTTIRILADLNHPPGFPNGFAQTAVLCAPEIKDMETIQELLKQAAGFANEHPQETIRILEEKEVFPSDILNEESIRRCRIHYRPAQETQNSIYSFLRLIQEYQPQSIGGALPDKNFIQGNP